MTGMVTRAHLAVGGAHVQPRGSVKQVDSTPVLLLPWGPDGHICQLVSVHVPQHSQSRPKAAPGVALLPAENTLTSPPSPLLKKTNIKTAPRQPLRPTPSPTQPRVHQPLTPRGKGHTDTRPPRVCS